MGSYYYLMAQLPYLFYDQKPPMSSYAFKDLARPFLSKTDYTLLEGLSLEPDKKAPVCADPDAAHKKASLTGCKFIDNWYAWERDLRFNVAIHRSKKLHRDTGELLNDYQSCSHSYPATLKDVAAVAATVVNHEGNPLEDEIFFDRERWSTIDTLAGNDYFNRNNVFAYYLKILLLERHILFNAEVGFSEYKSLYAQIIESPHEYIKDSGHNSTGEHK